MSAESLPSVSSCCTVLSLCCHCAPAVVSVLPNRNGRPSLCSVCALLPDQWVNGVHEEGAWEEASFLPLDMKQALNRAELTDGCNYCCPLYSKQSCQNNGSLGFIIRLWRCVEIGGEVAGTAVG